MEKVNQISKIVDYCRMFGSITQRQANMLGVYRLASRISDMKKIGYWIKAEMVQVTNSDNTTSRVARYTIVKEPEV